MQNLNVWEYYQIKLKILFLDSWKGRDFNIEFKDGNYEFSDLSIIQHIEEIANLGKYDTDQGYQLRKKEETLIDIKTLTQCLADYQYSNISMNDLFYRLNKSNTKHSHCFWCDYFENFDKFMFSKPITPTDLIYSALDNIHEMFDGHMLLIDTLIKFHKDELDAKILNHKHKRIIEITLDDYILKKGNN